MLKILTTSLALCLSALLSFVPLRAAAQQDTFALGLRLAQSVLDIASPTSSTNAAIVQMDYGSAPQAEQKALTTLAGSADPRIMATTQAYGNGVYTMAEIEASAKASLVPQQDTLLSKMRAAAVAARVSGVVWIFAQTVRPKGSVRNMKLSWYLLIAPGGRVLTMDPKVVEEDPTVVYMVYYSKAVGRSLPASYAWADAGLIKWQLRRYDGTAVTGWTTVDTGGAYDAPDNDSEQGPRCVATAETLGSCVQGVTTARKLMADNASRKSVIDYVRAVEASYNPASNGEYTPDVKISFDTRQYTRISCSVGTYRCAGSVGYTVVETLDRYTMADTDALPSKLNSLSGLNSSRPAQTFDVSVAVSDKPAVVDPFVIDPFDQPLALVSTSQMPGIISIAPMTIFVPPTSGDYTCPTGMTLSGTQCLSTSVTPANISYSCSSGTLSGSQCITSSGSPATANATYSCSSGTLVGTSCITTSSIPATPTTSYSCSSGTLSGSSCITSSSIPASASSGYSCSSGTLSGSSCITTSTSPASSSTSFSCPSGGSLSGSTCTTSSSSTYAAAGTQNTTYSCSSGTPVGTSCVSTTSTPATATYTCTDGSTPSGGTCTYSNVYQEPNAHCAAGDTLLFRDGRSGAGYCMHSVTSGAVTTYSCQAGTLNNNNCVSTTTTNATASTSTTYSCPSGGSLSGSTCTVISSSSYAATSTTSYSCSSGTLIGSTCYSSSSSPATYSTTYSCSSGTLVGSSCITSSSSPATATTTYSCTSGYTLSGSTCSASSSAPATSTIYYTCTTGTLSGTQCISTSTTPANLSYSCTSGTLSGSNCVSTNAIAATWVPLTCPD